jgi:hypothetical protein
MKANDISHTSNGSVLSDGVSYRRSLDAILMCYLMKSYDYALFP